MFIIIACTLTNCINTDFPFQGYVHNTHESHSKLATKLQKFEQLRDTECSCRNVYGYIANGLRFQSRTFNPSTIYGVDV